MAQAFECEVRFKIESIGDFEERLNRLGARIACPYEFIDHYYKPTSTEWNPVEKNLRIREWITPQKTSTIYFVKLEILSIGGLQFKRALCSEGKLPLFRGELNICKSLLEDLGFEFWFSLRKEKAHLWEMPKHRFFTAVEHIEGLGWTGELEFEGKDPEKAKSAIERALKVLRVPRRLVTHKPISAIYLETEAQKTQ
ncbi:MAG: CYTH domain-containing protein [Planctomycetota bacterium]|jgi:adenylate cyclase class IV